MTVFSLSDPARLIPLGISVTQNNRYSGSNFVEHRLRTFLVPAQEGGDIGSLLLRPRPILLYDQLLGQCVDVDQPPRIEPNILEKRLDLP